MTKLRQTLCKIYCRYYSASQATKKLPIISCKRPEYNHYAGQSYKKFDGIKLASSAWNNPKSKNDYFTVYYNANEVTENPVYKKSFEEIGLNSELVEIISRQRFSLPTAIQTKAIPALLDGYNAMVTAETGCGKTLAYLLPIIQQVLSWKPHVSEEFNSPLSVIITPSRELAKQISEVAESFVQNININVSTLIGGKTKQKMLDPPVEYCDILVTTLGAFSKLVTTGIYKIHNVHHLVLDEADTLLDDSFLEKLTHLLKKFRIVPKVTPRVPPSGCQLTMVSATMPVELPEAVNSFVDPQSLRMLSTKQLHRVMPHVPQKFVRLGKAQKPLELLKLVKADVNMKRPVMIFANKTSTCDFISMFLNENSIECININGQMAVALKTGKWDAYRTGQCDVISCTDIASRGLDTTRTQHVINYDFPLYTSDYIHRCGRTGRLGSPRDCLVTNFIAWPREISLVQKIESAVRTDADLPNVNANIKRIIQSRITSMATV